MVDKRVARLAMKLVVLMVAWTDVLLVKKMDLLMEVMWDNLKAELLEKWMVDMTAVVTVTVMAE